MRIEYKFTTNEDGNIAFHTTNDIDEVTKNRQNMAIKYGIKLENLRYMEQTHGCNVKIVTKNSPNLINDCDAIVTNEKNIPLMVMVADCIPILLKDDNKGVIAAIHAGRGSTFLKIVSKTVDIFKNEFNSNPSDIEAIFGQSIQKCCHEVSLELATFAKENFGESFVESRCVDLQAINKFLLQKLGVNKIIKSKICTCCSSKNLYSYRKNRTNNRFAGVIQIVDR